MAATKCSIIKEGRRLGSKKGLDTLLYNLNVSVKEDTRILKADPSKPKWIKMYRRKSLYLIDKKYHHPF
jgi:hypothetical protein